MKRQRRLIGESWHGGGAMKKSHPRKRHRRMISGIGISVTIGRASGIKQVMKIDDGVASMMTASVGGIGK